MNELDFDFEIYGNGFEKSKIICDLYKYIIHMTDDTYVEDIYKKISNIVIIENIIYDMLDINAVNKILIESPLFSLDGHSPKDAFITLFGQEAFDKLF